MMSIMRTLYLTAKERALVAALPPALRGQWNVEEETLTYQDTAERRAFRFRLMRVHDEQLLRFREEAAQAKTEAAFLDLVSTVDLRKVDSRDLTHVVFALGPDAMALLIADVLEEAKNSEDIELAAAFAALRHGMLESFSETSRTVV